MDLDQLDEAVCLAGESPFMLVADVHAGWGLDVLLAWVDAGLGLCNVEQVIRQEKDCEAKIPW